MRNNILDHGREYDTMLHRGIRLSGENKHFFMVRRIRDLCHQLPPSFRPHRILDFGCGIGDTTQFLADTFPSAEIIGLDTAENLLTYAEHRYASLRVSFRLVWEFSETETFDLCYVNGVFHHIEPSERPTVLRMIHKMLAPSGYFALFENNPWNPGTQLVMRRIPFDRSAQPLSSWATRYLLVEGGFTICGRPRFLFYFPRPLAFLRFSERWLAHLPFGAQYYVLAVKR